MPGRDAPAFGRHKAPPGSFVSGLSPSAAINCRI